MGKNRGNPGRVQRAKPNPQRLQPLKRTPQKLPLRAGHCARHNCSLSFSVKRLGSPDIIPVIAGGDREDAFVDPKVAQLR